MIKRAELLKTAREAALIGGEILNLGFRQLKKDQVKLKGAGDFVTELDHRSEEAIIKRIRQSFPDHVIQAEESGIGEGESRYRWFIDPLDGTTNYVHGVPIFSVSIAVALDDDLVAGVVLDPAHDEMFWAVKGGGLISMCAGSVYRTSSRLATVSLLQDSPGVPNNILNFTLIPFEFYFQSPPELDEWVPQPSICVSRPAEDSMDSGR
jgi:myo-inositol-1(or 4)-monophosphatase